MSPLLLDLVARERVLDRLAEVERDRRVAAARARSTNQAPHRVRGYMARALRALAVALDEPYVTQTRAEAVRVQPYALR